MLRRSSSALLVSSEVLNTQSISCGGTGHEELRTISVQMFCAKYPSVSDYLGCLEVGSSRLIVQNELMSYSLLLEVISHIVFAFQCCRFLSACDKYLGNWQPHIMSVSFPPFGETMLSRLPHGQWHNSALYLGPLCSSRKQLRPSPAWPPKNARACLREASDTTQYSAPLPFCRQYSKYRRGYLRLLRHSSLWQYYFTSKSGHGNDLSA